MCTFSVFVCVGKVGLADVGALKVCGEVRGITVSVLVHVLVLVVGVSFIVSGGNGNVKSGLVCSKVYFLYSKYAGCLLCPL
jgi:hypothetical protein